MKTPREILLERHHSAHGKLDAIRENVLAAVAAAGDRRGRGSIPIAARLSEVLASLRWQLAGLSAAWLLIALLDLEPSPAPMLNLAGQNSPTPRQLLASLRENRRQLLELVDPAVGEPAFPPRRRSEFAPFVALA